jgi:hypothetical protein
MNTSEIAKLVTCIEENLRASPSAGLAFVDLRHHRTRLVSRQNHVVFGRRGAGKTSLVGSVRSSDDFVHVYLNLEDYKDITFPNILIRVLAEVLSALDSELRATYSWYQFWQRKARKLRKEIRCTCDELDRYLHSPDEETQEINEREAYQGEVGTSAKGLGLGATAGEKQDRSREVKRKLPKSKIGHLRVELSEYKRLIQSVSDCLGDKPILLVLDDFYFVPKDMQPEFVDYFHRLTKGPSLFLKIATIKHRSKLYRRHGGQYIGAEIGHDIFEIDMDYTMDNFDELQEFMKQLLANAIKTSSATVGIDDLFAGGGFAQLCLTSGGVPRDFLSLFVSLANRALANGNPIGKVQVTDAALSTLGSKLESMKKDSGDEDSVLHDCLGRIKRYVYDEKRTNAFLVPRDDLDSDDVGRQAVRELVDLRLIHLVDHNTSKAPTDGRRYEAYILDISLYDNSRPRGFAQVDPGQRDEKARKDDLRASPVFSLSRLAEPMPEKPTRSTNTKPMPEKPTRSTDAEPLQQERQMELGLSFE